MKKRLVIIILLVVVITIYCRFKMNQNNPNVLLPLITQIENAVPYRDHINTDVSQVDVAWQIDHTLKTINRITEALEASDPNDYKSTLNASRVLSLTMGYIPRGRAQSPDIVKPPRLILTEAIYSQIHEAKINIERLHQLDNDSNFEHPVFGQIRKAEAIRFIELHTKHHLKIIDDILKD